MRAPPVENAWGTLNATADLRWLPDGRLAECLHGVTFTDPTGKDWPVPLGTKVDGASIPRPLWTLSGSPFVGKYRVPSIVHDYYCANRKLTPRSADVHHMFWQAMRCAGVPRVRAWKMWVAVRLFGPQWDFTQPKEADHGDDVDW